MVSAGRAAPEPESEPEPEPGPAEAGEIPSAASVFSAVLTLLFLCFSPGMASAVHSGGFASEFLGARSSSSRSFASSSSSATLLAS